jgi:hypothetical protein
MRHPKSRFTAEGLPSDNLNPNMTSTAVLQVFSGYYRVGLATVITARQSGQWYAFRPHSIPMFLPSNHDPNTCLRPTF